MPAPNPQQIAKVKTLEAALDAVDFLEQRILTEGAKFQVEIINRAEFYIYARRGFPLHPIDRKRAGELVRQFVYERKQANVRNLDAQHDEGSLQP